MYGNVVVNSFYEVCLRGIMVHEVVFINTNILFKMRHTTTMVPCKPILQWEILMTLLSSSISVLSYPLSLSHLFETLKVFKLFLSILQGDSNHNECEIFRELWE